MKVLLLLLSLTLASCQGTSSDSGDRIDLSINGDHSVDDPIPNGATTFDTDVTLVNFSANDTQKMNEAIEIIKLVVATEEFREKILNHTFNGKKTFVDNRGYTNGQIYQIILDGAEKLTPVKNNQMDVEVELYSANTNVVGYTYPNSKRIWVNSTFFNLYTPAGIAHNLFHEWMHKLGFEHATSWSVSRDSSVPYAVGDIMGEVGKKFL